MSYPNHIRKALRVIILAQCAGLIAQLLYNNGFMLAYFSQLGLPDYLIMRLFALLPLSMMVLTLPCAFISDRVGKKRFGGLGIGISAAGFFLLIGAPVTPENAALWLIAGTIIFSAGRAMNGASWFALLSPIVPEEIRGRWFGQMRTAWQTTAILFSLAVAALLKHDSSLPVFQSILVFCGCLILVKLLLYLRIPELERSPPRTGGLLNSLKSVFRTPGYLPFCAYIFLLSFLIGAVPNLLGLLEKKHLLFSDSQVLILGNLFAAGTVTGFITGGKAVDRAGSRPVFLTGHIIFSLALAGILLRGLFPCPTIATIGLFSFLFGAMQGATGIAGTSELLAIIPTENKSLSTGFHISLTAAGLSLSNLITGQILRWNVLQPHWVLFNKDMSAYDTLLALLMMLTLLLTVTSWLIPVISQLKSQWLPQNR